MKMQSVSIAGQKYRFQFKKEFELSRIINDLIINSDLHSMRWYDLVPEEPIIPLDVRYDDFKKRLAKARGETE